MFLIGADSTVAQSERRTKGLERRIYHRDRHNCTFSNVLDLLSGDAIGISTGRNNYTYGVKHTILI